MIGVICLPFIIFLKIYNKLILNLAIQTDIVYSRFSEEKAMKEVWEEIIRGLKQDPEFFYFSILFLVAVILILGLLAFKVL